MSKNIAPYIPDSSEIKSILIWKLSNLPSELIEYSISEAKIRKIIDELSVFSDTNSIIWKFLIEVDIRKKSNLLDVINNLRVNGFNFLLILYLFSESDVKEFSQIWWVKISREDQFLWDILNALKFDYNNEKKIIEELKKYISFIYKTDKPDFNVINNENWKSFLEFLISTYSYYLYMWDENQGWETVCSIILEFLNYFLDNNKINFTKENILIYVEKESEWSSGNAFIKWMNKIKKIFEDYERKDLKGQEHLNQWIVEQLSYTNQRVIGIYEKVSRI